ncbi:MAG: hypothetical protein P8Y47_12295 [Alphaproteobacteria bacterium]
MAIKRVTPVEAWKNWPYFERHIEKVLKRIDGGVNADDVFARVQLGTMQLWCNDEHDAIAVTEIQCYPNHKVLLMFMVSGEHAKKWFTEGQEHFDAFARRSGCKYVEFTGRSGWEKLARAHGFEEKFIHMRKNVKGADYG